MLQPHYQVLCFVFTAWDLKLYNDEVGKVTVDERAGDGAFSFARSPERLAHIGDTHFAAIPVTRRQAVAAADVAAADGARSRALRRQ